MEQERFVAMCHALGDNTRAGIFRFLLDCCKTVAVDEAGAVSPMEGATAGEVCCHITGIGSINSSISFHLKELREAGLITATKQGRRMVCAINQDSLRELAAFFAENLSCCTQESAKSEA